MAAELSASRRGLLQWAAGLMATAWPGLAFADRDDLGRPRVMQGPMMGAVTPTEALIWLRLSGDYFDAVIEYAEDDRGPWRATAPFRARAEDDYTVRAPITGLRPGREYFYRLTVNGKKDRYLRNLPPIPFRTAPEGPARFRVGFGSCARYQDAPEQPIWRAVPLWRPDLFLWLGDNIYGDSLVPEILANEYQRQRFVPSFQPVGRSVPQLAIWDDHDYGLDGYDVTNPVKNEALQLFRSYWANPSYGLPEAPGVFFSYDYGGVDFFMLDGRWSRTPYADPDSPDKIMLGAAQTEWLKARLKASRAPFKIVAHGSGWSKQGGPSSDTWAAYMHERTRLFDFIRDEEISGVVLLSGDTHFPQVNCIPESDRGGYDLYNLVSSALAQQIDVRTSRSFDLGALLAPEKVIRPPIFGTNNFGVIDFDMTLADPTLSFTVVDDRGRALYDPLELRASELVNGVVSWPSKAA